VLARGRAGGVGLDGAVGNSRVGGVDNQRNVVRGLEGRLVERRIGAPRIGGFKLRHGVVALGGLGEIEPAQFVVQNAGVGDGQSGLARGELFREGEGRLLLVLVERHGSCLLLASGGYGHGLKGDLDGVQGDRIGRLGQRHLDRFDAGEGGGLEVGRQAERVTQRADGRGQPLSVCGERHGRENAE
jgi:hypothetical protein